MSCKEWRKVRLGDVLFFNPKESIKKGAIVPKVAMDKLTPHNRCISGFQLEPFTSGTKFRNGDTLMARITPCLENGKTAYVSILDENEVAFGSTEFIVFREKELLTDGKFIYYLANSPWFRDIAIKSMVGSSGRQRVQQSVLEDLEFTLPSLKEQQRIAAILGALDDKIELNNKINKNLEEQASALFKHWFVDFEFPDANGKPYKSSGGAFKDSELGPIPSEWEIKQLVDVAELYAGGDKPEIVTKTPTIECKVPIYSNGISNEGLYGYAKDAKIFHESVTISARGTIGYVCLRQKPYVPIVRLISVVPNDDVISAKYLYHTLINENILGTGTTQQQLTVPDFKRTKILVPNLTIVKEFTKSANIIYKTIEANKVGDTIIAQLRDALLPKLMNNEVLK